MKKLSVLLALLVSTVSFAEKEREKMIKSCRNCDHAYLRTEKTNHYNYEACGLGYLPMMPFLTGCCHYYIPASEEKLKTYTNKNISIQFGEPLEL